MCVHMSSVDKNMCSNCNADNNIDNETKLTNEILVIMAMQLKLIITKRLFSLVERIRRKRRNRSRGKRESGKRKRIKEKEREEEERAREEQQNIKGITTGKNEEQD